MCTQKPPNNWSEHLYNNYCDAVKEYLSTRILPCIKEKHDEAMLTVSEKGPLSLGGVLDDQSPRYCKGSSHPVLLDRPGASSAVGKPQAHD